MSDRKLFRDMKELKVVYKYCIVLQKYLPKISLFTTCPTVHLQSNSLQTFTVTRVLQNTWGKRLQVVCKDEDVERIEVSKAKGFQMWDILHPYSEGSSLKLDYIPNQL